MELRDADRIQSCRGLGLVWSMVWIRLHCTAVCQWFGLSGGMNTNPESKECEPLLVSNWERALFIHFEVDAGALQAEVPFRLDLREGKAYVSLVAFTMGRMRPRFGGSLAEWCFKPIATHELLN